MGEQICARKDGPDHEEIRIDDFCLWGSRTWRRMGGHPTKKGWRIQVVHDFDNYKSALSETEALTVVVQAVLGNPHWPLTASYPLIPRALPGRLPFPGPWHARTPRNPLLD